MKFDTYESVYTWSERRALTALDMQFQATLGNPVVVNVDVESQSFIITTAAKEQTVKRNPRTRKSDTSPPPSYPPLKKGVLLKKFLEKLIIIYLRDMQLKLF